MTAQSMLVQTVNLFNLFGISDQYINSVMIIMLKRRIPFINHACIPCVTY